MQDLFDESVRHRGETVYKSTAQRKAVWPLSKTRYQLHGNRVTRGNWIQYDIKHIWVVGYVRKEPLIVYHKI